MYNFGLARYSAAVTGLQFARQSRRQDGGLFDEERCARYVVVPHSRSERKRRADASRIRSPVRRVRADTIRALGELNTRIPRTLRDRERATGSLLNGSEHWRAPQFSFHFLGFVIAALARASDFRRKPPRDELAAIAAFLAR